MQILLNDVSGLAKGCTSLLAAASAIALGFRSPSEWEPCEQDLPTAPRKVGSLIATVGIAVLFATFSHSNQEALLTYVAAGFTGACVLSLLIYLFLHAAFTYENAKAQKCISGFVLTDKAREMKKKGSPQQEILRKHNFRKERVWTHGSTVVAKLVFVVTYLILTTSGTLALASSGLLISIPKDISVTVKVLSDAQGGSGPTVLYFEFDDGDHRLDSIELDRPARVLLPRKDEDRFVLISAYSRCCHSDKIKVRLADNISETLMLRPGVADLIEKKNDNFSRGYYENALEGAQLALRINPNDPDAMNILKGSRTALYSLENLP